MVAIKKTLLQMTQDILESLDSDNVNSIVDTVEASQVVDIIVQTYFDLISDRTIPEHKELFRFVALADSTRPNYLQIPDDVAHVETFWYNKASDGDTDKEYRKINYLEPEKFLEKTSSRNGESSDVIEVPDFNASTEFLIYNDRMPQWWTSFDNKHIVCDAYDADEDSTLQQSKSRGWGKKIPTVTLADATVLDIEAAYFPYVLAEAKSRAFADLHKTVNQKAEQWAKRHKNFIQTAKYRTEQENSRPAYGRR